MFLIPCMAYLNPQFLSPFSPNIHYHFPSYLSTIFQPIPPHPPSNPHSPPLLHLHLHPLYLLHHHILLLHRLSKRKENQRSISTLSDFPSDVLAGLTRRVSHGADNTP